MAWAKTGNIKGPAGTDASAPDTTNKKGQSLTNDGTPDSSFWSQITCNPIVMTEDQTLMDGVSAIVASGFTIAAGKTLTIPAGSVLVIV